MTDERIDLISKLWNIGNVITGFTVIQSIAVIYFVIEKTVFLKKWDTFVPLSIMSIVGGAALYMFAVYLCYKAEHNLRNAINEDVKHIKISTNVFIGRLVTIAIFNLLAISITMIAWFEFNS